MTTWLRQLRAYQELVDQGYLIHERGGEAMTTKTVEETYPHSRCEFCEQPAIGDGLGNNAPFGSPMVRVCEAHRFQVWAFMPFRDEGVT